MKEGRHDTGDRDRGRLRRSGWRAVRLRRVIDGFLARPVWARWLIGAPVVLLALVAVLVVTDLALAAGRIHPGVRIGPVGVGGLTRVAAAERVVEELEPRLDAPVIVGFEGREWEVEAETVGVRLDPEGYAEGAYLLGRQGSLWRRVRERMSFWVVGAEVDPYVLGEVHLTTELFDGFDEVIGIEPVDAVVSIEGTSAEILPATVGLEVDRITAQRLLMASFIDDERLLDLPVRLIPVAVTEIDAQDALEDALTMLAGSLSLEYERSEWTIGGQEIGGWIGFKKVPWEAAEEASSETTPAELPGRMSLEAYLMTEAVSTTVLPLTKGIGRETKDARFRVSSGSVTIIPSEEGLEVDMESLTRALEITLMLEGDERRSVLRMRTVSPELTTEEAQAMGIDDRLASYRTTFSSSNKPRVNNIHTLTDALDGTLIPPGGIFSFNGAVGPRTADKGYQEAGTIVNGRLVPTLGGGICQVCTTLFNTVFFSGLPVEERSNHSFYISHYPTGRDATVSWGGPDFKFRNDTSAWVLIATAYTSSSVTISLYGTDPGYEVEYVTGSWRDIKAHATQEADDPELDEGVRIIEEGGVDGRAVTVTRRVYKDGTLVREDHFASKYNPKTEFVRVGTRPLPEVEEPSEEETPTVGD